MDYTKEEIDELNKREQKLIAEYRSKDIDFQTKTKGKFIKELSEILDLKIELGLLKIEKSDIRSYIQNEIVTKNELDISERTIRENLKPEYKRNYSESAVLANSNKSFDTIFEDEGIKLEKSNDIIKLNGVTYKKTDEVKDTIKVQKDWDSSDDRYVIDPLKSSITKKLLFYKQMADEISKSYWKIIEKFFEAERIDYDFDKLSKKELKNEYDLSYLKSIPSMKKKAEENRKLIKETIGADIPKEDLDLYVKISKYDMQFDDRNLWTEYEKIISSMLIQTGNGIAEMAHIMGYSEKYGSIGLLRGYNFDKNDPSHQELRKKLGRCPNCNEWVAHSINENISKYNMEQALELLCDIEPERLKSMRLFVENAYHEWIEVALPIKTQIKELEIEV